MNPSAGLVVTLLSSPGAPAVWGRSPAERIRRQVRPLNLPVAGDGTPRPAGPVLMLRGDVVVHQSVLSGLAGAAGVALVDDRGRPLAANVPANPGLQDEAAAWLQRDEGEPPAGLRRVVTTDVADVYNAKLRRRDDPYAVRVDRANLAAIEKRIFLGTYKGVTDLVTKYWWPVPARIVTGWCVRLGVSPNVVTTISGVLAVIVCVLFARGEFGLGLLLAWPMTFLDTVDGKLARVTLTSSRFGDLFDHGIDLLHPPAWYYTWAMGLAPVLGPAFWPLVWTIFGAYVAGRLCEGYFARRFGFHLHVWRRFDSVFRLVLARRNPNLILLTVAWIAGRPDVGLWLVAVWTVVTFVIHCGQVAQSIVAARRGPLHSWLESSPGGAASGRP